MYQYGHIYSPSKSSKKFVYNRMAGVPPAGTSFSSAFIEYKRFFERETGVGWDDRVAAFHKGKGHAKGDGFVYELPVSCFSLPFFLSLNSFPQLASCAMKKLEPC